MRYNGPFPSQILKFGGIGLKPKHSIICVGGQTFLTEYQNGFPTHIRVADTTSPPVAVDGGDGFSNTKS